jgi:hypothetical protein
MNTLSSGYVSISQLTDEGYIEENYQAIINAVGENLDDCGAGSFPDYCFATQTWVEQQEYVTSNNLNDAVSDDVASYLDENLGNYQTVMVHYQYSP